MKPHTSAWVPLALQKMIKLGLKNFFWGLEKLLGAYCKARPFLPVEHRSYNRVFKISSSTILISLLILPHPPTPPPLKLSPKTQKRILRSRLAFRHSTFDWFPEVFGYRFSGAKGAICSFSLSAQLWHQRDPKY